MTYSNMIYK
jgi:hypothetical protein